MRRLWSVSHAAYHPDIERLVCVTRSRRYPQDVPLGMSRLRPEHLDPAFDPSVAADVRVRQEPDEEEDEEDDDKHDEEDDDEEEEDDDGGYSE
jgi:hypothetical protein